MTIEPAQGAVAEQRRKGPDHIDLSTRPVLRQVTGIFRQGERGTKPLVATKNIKKKVFMSLQYKLFLIPIKDLDAAEEAFNRFLRTVLKLGLKDNIQLNCCTHGLPFLGFRIFPETTKLSNHSKRRLIIKYRTFEQNVVKGRWSV